MNNANADHVLIASGEGAISYSSSRWRWSTSPRCRSAHSHMTFYPYLTSKKRSGVHISDLRERFRGFILVSAFVFFRDEAIVCGKVVSEDIHVFLKWFSIKKADSDWRGKGHNSNGTRGSRDERLKNGTGQRVMFALQFSCAFPLCPCLCCFCSSSTLSL